MRISHSKLTFKALVALDEAVQLSRKSTVKPTAALRFALAWLYANSRLGDRKHYDEFWQVIQDPMENRHSDHESNYIRGTSAQTAFNGIARQAGIELTPEVCCQLYQARLSKADRVKYRNSPTYRFSQRHKSSPSNRRD